MTLAPTAAAFLLLLQPGHVEGVVVDGYPDSLGLRVACDAGPGTDGSTSTTTKIIRMAVTPNVTHAYRWDGAGLAPDAIRPGDRARVDVAGEYLSAYAAGTVVRVVVGPPAGPLDGPDAGFVVAQEAWVAGQDAETRALVRNLASRSWAVRERATRGLMEMGHADRARGAGVLSWGLEQPVVAGDVEARGRVTGLRRALWIEGEVGR